MFLISANAKTFARQAYVAMDTFVATRERFGVCSTEFALITTKALAVLEVIERGGIDEKVDTEKIKKCLDLKQMINSWSILPPNTECIFKNYLRDIERINLPK